MIELPEALTLAKQASRTLTGKTIVRVGNATKRHRFTFFNGDPLEYGKILVGKAVESARGYGIFVDLLLTDGAVLSIGDGTIMTYGRPGDKIPAHYQLLLTFDDRSFLVFTVAMYGPIGVYADGIIDNPYHKRSVESISPLDDRYTEERFERLFTEAKKDWSAKALLATEQRIPGVGNGVLQDILFRAGVHPKRRISTFCDQLKTNLFHSLKTTLAEMAERGGRNTQTDLYGNKGGYPVILSSKTWQQPCPACHGSIVREAYMGGSVYYCPHCQPQTASLA